MGVHEVHADHAVSVEVVAVERERVTVRRPARGAGYPVKRQLPGVAVVGVHHVDVPAAVFTRRALVRGDLEGYRAGHRGQFRIPEGAISEWTRPAADDPQLGKDMQPEDSGSQGASTRVAARR
jgi:hypothetical protein